MPNRVLIIAGPTASGKSRLAVDAARHYGGVVINADSQQVYKHIPILSACPSDDARKLVPHRLYEIYEPSRAGSVVDWLELAVAEIKKAWAQKLLPVVVGGTGLYIDNLLNGTTPIPETPQDVRSEVAALLTAKGVNVLHAELGKIDQESAARLNPNDTTRVRRAYEVFMATGRPLSLWHKLPMVRRLPEAAFCVIRLLPPQAELDERCARRFDQMMKAGALAEAEYMRGLNLSSGLPAMRALGLPELLDYLSGKCSLDDAVRLAKLHSRQYAKRQRTWFGNKLQADMTLNECYRGEVRFEDLKI